MTKFPCCFVSLYFSLNCSLHSLCWIDEKDNVVTNVANINCFYHVKIKPLVWDVMSYPNLMLNWYFAGVREGHYGSAGTLVALLCLGHIRLGFWMIKPFPHPLH